MIIKNISHELPFHGEKTYRSRNLLQILNICYHHTATPGGTPERFATYHVKNRNYPGIGYHYVITKNEIFQTNPLNIVCYGVKMRNTKTVNIALVGNFELHEPNQFQIDASIYLGKYLQTVLKNARNITNHKELTGSTLCPGIKFPINLIRNKINGI